MRQNAIDYVSWVLLIIGGLNWALVGLFNYNLVGSLFGDTSFLSRAIYVLVGLAAVYEAIAIVVRATTHREAVVH